MRRFPSTLLNVLLIASFVLSACDVISVEIVTEEPSTNGSSTTDGGGDVSFGVGDGAGLPDMPIKPKPTLRKFNGCPPEGDGGDPELNRRKNRSDLAEWIPVAYDAVVNLGWPEATQRRDHEKWSDEDAAAVAQYEGLPISIEGYLAGAKESGPETANCHGEENQNVDWHLWLVKNSGDDRTNAIVIEPTPRSRAKKEWTLKKLRVIVEGQYPVRISGWLFYDNEHPEQLGKTRGTLWEIHPIMEIEVQDGGQWVLLDDWGN